MSPPPLGPFLSALHRWFRRTVAWIRWQFCGTYHIRPGVDEDSDSWD